MTKSFSAEIIIPAGAVVKRGGKISIGQKRNRRKAVPQAVEKATGFLDSLQ